MVHIANSRSTDILYGNTECRVALPHGSMVYSINEPQNRMSEDYFSSIVTSYLKRTALDLSNPIIVVADKTRLCGYKTYLPLLVKLLEDYGLNKNCLRFIIGYGTHPRQSDDECLSNYGEVYTNFTFIHHDSTVLDNFIHLGTTPRGTPRLIHKDVVQASSVITMGAICHHYFAGYGGGRKLIFPGCGEREAIYANHGLYLDHAHMRLSQNCQPGKLEGNPIAEDLFDIGEKKAADLAIHGIMNSGGELCDIVVGRGKTEYYQACALHAQSCEVQTPPAPIVIASCGGYPKDINFIQSHKAIHNASMLTADGGVLLIFSECRDGVGSETFLPWFKVGGFAEAFKQLAADYHGNGGTALAMMDKTQRIRIFMVTELAEEVCQLMNVGKWSMPKAVDYIQHLHQPVAYIPNASLLVNRGPAR